MEITPVNTSEGLLECDMMIAVLLTESEGLYRSTEVSRLLFDPQEAPLEHQHLAVQLEHWMHQRMSTNVAGVGFPASYAGMVWKALMDQEQRTALRSRLTCPDEGLKQRIELYTGMEKTRSNLARTLGLARNQVARDYRLICNSLLSSLTRLEGALSKRARKSAAAKMPVARVNADLQPEQNHGRAKKRFSLRAMTLVSMIGLVAVAFFASNLPDKTFDILKKEGLGKASHYFEGMADKDSRTPAAVYQAAWLAARTGKLPEAEQIVGQLLQTSDLPIKLKGDCFYLQGQILITRGNYQDSLSRFVAAGEIYTGENLPANSYVNAVAMAMAYTMLGQYNQSEDCLTRARTFFEQSDRTSVNLSPYYGESARLASKKGEFQVAIEQELKRVEISKRLKQDDDLAGALSNLGYYHLRLGLISKAYDYSLSAQELIQEFSDNRRHYFNQINFVGIMKCQGVEPGRLVEAISAWADSHEDSDLKKFLEETLNLCKTGGIQNVSAE